MAKISDEACPKAAGKNFHQWFAVLREEEAEPLPHKELARILREKHGASPWWSQEITVAYEKAEGRRVLGQTEAAGFQVGASRTLPVDPRRAWTFLSSLAGTAAWLEAKPAIALEEGRDFICGDGVTGTVTVVGPSHARLRWSPKNWKAPSILQIRVSEAGRGQTTVTFHHEKLPGPPERERMRTHWQAALNKIETNLPKA